MKTANEMGSNRTGVATSPFDSLSSERGADAGELAAGNGELPMATLRLEAAQESDRVGSMPPPATVKGVVKTAITMLQGERANVFLNKLGERLAFERTGVRLYAAVIDKLPAFATANAPAGPTLADLRSIQEDELRHVDVVRRAIEKLGGDPTAMTPAADLVGVATSGVLQVASDPRTQLGESLQALLIAELVDNDGWEGLIELARGFGQAELAAAFVGALAEEQVHLAQVRTWLAMTTRAAAGLQPDITATFDTGRTV